MLGPILRVSDSAGLGWDLKICISSKFSDDASASHWTLLRDWRIEEKKGRKWLKEKLLIRILSNYNLFLGVDFERFLALSFEMANSQFSPFKGIKIAIL